jgi:GxxExxY protein
MNHRNDDNHEEHEENEGCAIAVHKELGPGFIESVYRKAMCVELESRNLAYEEERPIRVLS